MSRPAALLTRDIDIAEPSPARGLLARLAAAIALPFAALAEAVRIRRELGLLANLSERELRDIGLPPEAVARLIATRRRFDPFTDSWR
jgi:uncharacterized protein YjiS (DUF1127 family)